MTFPNARQAALDLLAQQIARQAVTATGYVQQTLQRPGSGRSYRKGSVIHRASKPGDAPAVDTGRLVQSISAQQVTPFHWRVGTNLEYALLLEFGTAKIAPRPFMRPAAQALRSKP